MLLIATSLHSLAYAIAPDVLPGWSSGSNKGVPIEGRPVLYSSPVVAEIDGDATNGLETAVTASSGVVSVVGADGQLKWSYRLPNYGCDTSSTNKAYSSPAVGDLFGDGQPYVVAAYGGLGARNCDGGVVALRGSDGALLWRFSTKKWAKKYNYGSALWGVFSTPGLADVDGDGKLEIGFGGFDRNVYLLNADGSARWFYHAADTVWSSPTFVNVDSDPDLEMIIGTDISRNDLLSPPTKNGGYIYAFKTKDQKSKRYGFRDRSAYLWQTYVDQVVFGSPVVANVIAGDPAPQIIIQSGCYFPTNSTKKTGNWIKILRLTDGKVLQTLRTSGCSSSTPAVADIDGDGVMEIIASTNGSTSIGGTGRGKLSAWKASSSTPIWSIIPFDKGGHDPFVGHFQSPVIADIDGNGSLEVLLNNQNGIGIYDATDGSAYTCQLSNCADNPLRLAVSQGSKNTPAIADVNGDGILDVIVAAGEKGRAKLYSWTNLDQVINSSAGAYDPYAAPWPQWRGNAHHDGIQPPPATPPASE